MKKIFNKELERSMNLQSRVMTIEETLRNSDVIDKIDDKRRDKMHGVLRWAKDIHKSIINDLREVKKISEGKNLELVDNLLQKTTKFSERFEKTITKLIADEEVLERLDDENRVFLIKYAKTTREELKKDNSIFEQLSIEKRLNIEWSAQTVVKKYRHIVLSTR